MPTVLLIINIFDHLKNIPSILVTPPLAKNSKFQLFCKTMAMCGSSYFENRRGIKISRAHAPNILIPFSTLQFRQASLTFSQVFVPPLHIGITCSIVGASVLL